MRKCWARRNSTTARVATGGRRGNFTFWWTQAIHEENGKAFFRVPNQQRARRVSGFKCKFRRKVNGTTLSSFSWRKTLILVASFLKRSGTKFSWKCASPWRGKEGLEDSPIMKDSMKKVFRLPCLNSNPRLWREEKLDPSFVALEGVPLKTLTWSYNEW